MKRQKGRWGEKERYKVGLLITQRHDVRSFVSQRGFVNKI
jgi:hypothetical protein